MDPEGVRQVFLAECGSAADYGIRRALRALPFAARFTESFFYGVHLPLTRPLPKRLDVTLQQHVGLHACDAVVLADIDPVIFDADDLLNLLAYVEAGGGLLLAGGPNSFCNAQRNWGPLREALPASFMIGPTRRTRLWNAPPPTEEQIAPEPVLLVDEHPLGRGLCGELGTTAHLHAVQPEPDASVVAAAAGKPVVVAGRFGQGRVLMVSAYPGPGEGCMFGSPAWADLLRQGLAWLMGRDEDLVIEGCDMRDEPMPVGQERAMTVQFDSAVAPDTRVKPWVRRADPGWLSVGREPQYAEECEQEFLSNECRAAFHFAPSQPGLYEVGIEASGKDWANVRMVEVRVRSETDLRLSSSNGEYTFAPGQSFRLDLHANGTTQARLRIVDFDGNEVWLRDDVGSGPVEIPIPQWELGEYEVIAETDDDRAQLRFCVTRPLRQIGFSFVANASGPTEERVRWWFDYFRSRGFDAFATSLPEETHAAPSGFRPAAFQHYLVQREGLELWGEYLGAALLSTHSHYGEEGSNPTRPCVFSPEYGQALRDLLEPKFRAAASLPRMASLEILDEPHLMRPNVCRCDYCLQRYRERFGEEMPTWDEALASRDQQTSNYFEWVVDYAAEAFRTGHETWKSFGPVLRP